jgi:hypothetical protein
MPASSGAKDKALENATGKLAYNIQQVCELSGLCRATGPLATFNAKPRPVARAGLHRIHKGHRNMNNITAALGGGKGRHHPDDAGPAHCSEIIPAPAPELYGLLALLRRPMPLSKLRPAAIAAGLSMDRVESALSIATRRGELRIEAGHDGTILAVRCRP